MRSEPAAGEKVEGSRYVDPTLGFEVVRPSGAWTLDANGDRTPEGVSLPVVMKNQLTGAQVVIQVAPSAATPTQYAERLTQGLRQQPGFVATDPRPLSLAEGAVGFSFEMGQQVSGRVAVVDGGDGQVFMLMATWPKGAPQAAEGVEEIFTSLKPVPRG